MIERVIIFNASACLFAKFSESRTSRGQKLANSLGERLKIFRWRDFPARADDPPRIAHIGRHTRHPASHSLAQNLRKGLPKRRGRNCKIETSRQPRNILATPQKVTVPLQTRLPNPFLQL